MRTRGHVSGISGRVCLVRRRLPLGLAGLLGAAVVVLPAVASSEPSPTIEAVNESGYYNYHRWLPTAATISAGGAVTFKNTSETLHGVEWRPGNPATPSCSGVPVGSGAKASGTQWNGTCTFAQPGTYKFWCTVHGSEMSATIMVSSTGTTTTTTTPAGTTTTTTTTTGPANGTAGYSTSTTPTGASPQGGAGAGSPLVGSASQAIRLPSSQRGSAVRGSVAISPAGAGGRLQVDLLASSASLAGAGQASRVRVGRISRSHLHAGRISFSVPLNARGRRALRRRGRLALSAKLSVTTAGVSVSSTRGIVLRP